LFNIFNVIHLKYFILSKNYLFTKCMEIVFYLAGNVEKMDFGFLELSGFKTIC